MVTRGLLADPAAREIVKMSNQQISPVARVGRAVRNLPASRPGHLGRVLPYLPGLGVCVAGAVLSWSASRFLPEASPLLIAILLGVLWRNLLPVSGALSPGTALCAKNLLRAGIVLLGLQLSLSSILELGPGVWLIALLSVILTFTAALWLGKLLGVGPAQRLLIASGFSICGAAAVAAIESATRARKEETATAIALVVLCGTLMIPALPFLGGLLGLPERTLGVWIGASTHEVAQVVAAGEAVGGTALAVAVTVKLARVLMLAPIVAGVALHARRSKVAGGGNTPPVVPLFILGFVGAMLLRTTNLVPPDILDTAEILHTLLLSAAMFALGLGVHVRALLRVGQRPALLGLGSTLVILTVSLAAILVIPLH